MREQLCSYMCPWPRIQTAMLDEKSLVVTYKHWRGEKRGSLKKAEANPGAFGDCIDCNQCVAVCPTGIDIREGPQIGRSEEHTSELQSLMRISYAVFCLKKKKQKHRQYNYTITTT